MELTLDQALQKGVEAHKAGKAQEADKYYTAILKANPKHPDANHNMGVLAVGVGKVEAALPFFKTALEINPNIEQFWLSYIDAFIKLDRMADAKSVLEQAKSNGVKGDVFEQIEDRLTPSSVELKNETHDVTPKQSNILDELRLDQALRLASQKVRHGLTEDAQKIYRDIIKKFPKNKKAKYMMKTLAGTTLDNKSDMQEPDSGQLQGLTNLYTQGQYQEVQIQTSNLIKKFPNTINLYNILGAANQSLGKLEEAIEAYNKALSINPDFAEAYNNIGIARKNQGKLKEAIEAYSKALSIKPDFAEAFNNMGNARKNQGKLEEALEAFNKALSIKPDYAEAYYNIGNAWQEQGKLEEAIKAYKEALSINPDYAEVWDNLYLPLQAMKFQKQSDQSLGTLHLKDINSNYSKIQLNILDYKLNRGQESEGVYLESAMKSLSDAKNISIKNPTFDNNFQEKRLTLPDKMVALVHFGRSGTGLMHSLIDGHPEVSTLPSIYFSEYFDHSNWVKLIFDGWDGMIDRFVAAYEVLFDASSSVPVESKNRQLLHSIGKKEGMANVGDQRSEVLKVNKDLFKSELKYLTTRYAELDAFVFFELVQMAYDKAINDYNSKSLVFYHIHNPDTYAQLNFINLNPNANFLFMVREPLQSCESWARPQFVENDHFGIANKLLIMLFEIDNCVYSRRNTIGVRLEDLKHKPRETIPALCNWMGIMEEDSLYEMTAQGKKWWGDPSSPDFKKDGHDPFGKTSINRKIGSVFSKNDQFVLRTLFYPFNVRFGYTEENEKQFKADLQEIRPKLDEMLDFEKKIAEQMHMNFEKMMCSGSYLYLRSGLIERWNTLNEFGTYPNMIRPLKI